MALIHNISKSEVLNKICKKAGFFWSFKSWPRINCLQMFISLKVKNPKYMNYIISILNVANGHRYLPHLWRRKKYSWTSLSSIACNTFHNLRVFEAFFFADLFFIFEISSILNASASLLKKCRNRKQGAPKFVLGFGFVCL
jgi:hypothetical protein